MKKLSGNTDFIFILGSLGLGSVGSHDWPAAVAFITMAVGVGLCAHSNVLALNNGTAASSISTWRHYGPVALLYAGIALLSYQIGQSFHAAFN